MATLAVQTITTAGVVPAALVAAAGGGDQVANNGSTVLIVANGGGSPITVTVAAQVACDQGTTHNMVVTVANGVTRHIRLPASRYTDANGFSQITYSAVTSVTVGAYTV